MLLDYFSQDSRNLLILFTFVFDPHFYIVSSKVDFQSPQFSRGLKRLEHLNDRAISSFKDISITLDDGDNKFDLALARDYNIY